jgi:hypothetical protein
MARMKRMRSAATCHTNRMDTHSTDGPEGVAVGVASVEETCQSTVARFFLVHYIYQNEKNIPNYHKIYQMTIKYIKCP